MLALYPLSSVGGGITQDEPLAFTKPSNSAEEFCFSCVSPVCGFEGFGG